VCACARVSVRTLVISLHEVLHLVPAEDAVGHILV